ncbi:hypothetical protein SLS62_005636 [Diatrype stigma]|uniref:Uncharacterized protein n=1 Tax=Diatrype stigma TaxID=117547 RepID=A0AAN9V2V8_9PEZI
MAQLQPLNFLITGAGRGIGRGLSRLLLQKGHRVFLVDNDVAELQHTTTSVLSRFPKDSFSSSITDLRRPEQIREAVSQATTFFNNHLDVLINNAAFTGSVTIPFESLTLEDWNKALQVNLTAPMLVSQACLPLLRGREGRPHGGTIINMSSTRARQSEPNSEGYGATKAGLIGLTQSLASSLADLGITVNTILPGWINVADECKEADEKGLKWEDGLSEEDHRWHLSGRVGKVEDVLGAVEFLVKERFVNGQEIVVDGGVSRKMVYPE